jgi:hypothetical protein
MRILSVIALTAFVTGCAASPRYAYRPTAQSAAEDAPGDLDGLAAAGYPVARGDVRIAAVGIATARLHNGRAARALEVRIVVHNGSRDVWIVESIDQRATVNDAHEELEPVLARCDGDVMPEAVLMPDDTRTIDLYYELPPSLADGKTVPSVRVAWRVATPSGVVAQKTTAFERYARPPDPEPPVDLRAIRRQLADSRPEWRGWRN